MKTYYRKHFFVSVETDFSIACYLMDASMFVVFVVTLTMVICSHLIKQLLTAIISLFVS